MKRLPLFFIAGALALAAAAPFTSNVFASIPADSASRVNSAPPSAYPLGERVVITVDSESGSTPVYAGDANVITGFNAPDAISGILVEENGAWLILREGKIEKWVPKNKILLMSFCD